MAPPKNGRILEEQRQPGDQYGGDSGRRQVELVEQHAGEVERRVRQADVELLDVRAPGDLTDALEHEVETDRCHEQDNAFLVDQMAQHQVFDRDGQDHHDGQGQHDGERDGHTAFHEPDQGQSGEQHHGPLGEIEDAGGLEDKDEAECHQGIHDPGQQAGDDDFQEEDRRVGHVCERGILLINPC